MWVLGGLVLGGLAVLFMLRSDMAFLSIHYVPEGTPWQRFYRQMKDKRKARRLGPPMWMVLGAGLGLLVIGIILAVVL